MKFLNLTYANNPIMINPQNIISVTPLGENGDQALIHTTLGAEGFPGQFAVSDGYSKVVEQIKLSVD